jgi:hypothetical protein
VSGRFLTAGVIALVLMAGCDSDSTSPEMDAHVGTYALANINGIPLPLPIDEFEAGGQSCTEIVTGGTLNLAADNSWTVSLDLLLTCVDTATGAETNISETEGGSGTYTVSGNTVSFTENGEEFTGVLSGNSLSVSIDDDGFTLILQFSK